MVRRRLDLPNSTLLNKVKKLAFEYSINIKEVDTLIFVKHKCPFNSNLGIINRNTVALKGSCVSDICVMIHEIGHCVWDKSQNFESANEFSWLIWEFMFAEKLDLVKEWDKANWNYMLDNGLDWGQISQEEKIDKLLESFKQFQKITEDDILVSKPKIQEAVWRLIG